MYLDKGRIRKTAAKLIVFTAIIAAIIFLPKLQAHAEMIVNASKPPENHDTQVNLSWSPVVDAQYYAIYRNGSLLQSIDIDAVLDPFSFTDKGLRPETSYNYEVRAFDKNWVNLDSGTANITTSQMPAPTINSIKYDINTCEIAISWQHNSLAAAGSIVQRADGTTMDTVNGPHTSTVFTDPDLSGREEYAVISNDGAGHFSPKSDPAVVVPIEVPQITASIQNGISKISWGSYPYITFFNLERSKWNGASWGSWEIAATMLEGTEITDIPASAGSYRYRLSARSSSNYSGHSNISQTVTKPAAPSEIYCELVSPNKIKIFWINSPENTSELILEWKEGQNGTYRELVRFPSDTGLYFHTFSFSQGAEYFYRITAFDSPDNMSVGPECSVTTSIPNAPSSLVLTVESSNQVRLNWNDNSNNETLFSVERSINGGNFEEIGTTSYNTAVFVDSGLQPENTYTYRVRAMNAMGYSAYTNQVPVITTAISPPNSLTVTPVSSSRIDLSWTYLSSASHRTVIERKTGAGGTWSVITPSPLPEGVTTYSNTGLSSGTEYFYRIKAVSGTDLNVYSTSYPKDSTGVGAATLLGNITLHGNASPSNRIYLSWSGGSGGTEYVIERKGLSGDFVSIASLSSDARSWFDTGVIPNAQYTYRIKARSATNESVYSNEVTIANTYLESPSFLQANVVSGSVIELKWVDNSINETAFEVWRKVHGENDYKLYATLGQNAKSFIDDEVNTGIQYYYMVRAYSDQTNTYSAFSYPVSLGVGILTPPSNLNYSVTSDTQITLTWKDNSDNENSFKVERKVGEDGSWTEITTLSANTTSYSISGLVPYVHYYFRVRAYSYNYSSGSYSNEIEVSTGVPKAPSSLVVDTLSSSEVSLSWKDNSTNELGFKIERRKQGESRYRVIGEVGPGTTGYMDRGLSAGTRYYYRVQAFNKSGSSNSEDRMAITKEPVTFDDINNVSWAKGAIESLASRGIVKGKSERLFKPNDIITRAEFVSIIVRAFDLSMAPVGSFADVKPGKWFYNDVMTAKFFGIVSGDGNNLFHPDKPITREDIAVIIVRALNIAERPVEIFSSSVLEKFIDKALVSPYALSSVATLYGEGIISGKPGNVIAPRDSASRAEAAVLVYRSINIE